MKEGRGRGSGRDYKPRITIQDFSSKGRSSRTPGWKSNRVHHFFSDQEKRLFYLFEWSDTVTDIREQFPLDDLDLAMSIATDMGIKYPVGPQSGTPYVSTSDFMLIVNNSGKQVQIAQTVKQSTKLGKIASAVKAYAQRFGREAIFRDCKTGGDNHEGSKANSDRLVRLILLIALAMTSVWLQGQNPKLQRQQHYVCRSPEKGRTRKRHSNFWIGLSGKNWLATFHQCQVWVEALMDSIRNKQTF